MNRRRFNQIVGLSGMGILSRSAYANAFESGNQVVAQDIRGKNLWDHYFIGAAYYPEWWPSEDWEIDFREMHALGINTVRMGEFAWSSFEPSEGKFSFDWMDRAIEIARRYKIDVILSTPTAAVPPWLYSLHPDVLGANASGPYTYGGRKGYCTNSPHYLAASAQITTALAEHYGSNPTVIGWQLDNEPGIPFECYDDNCLHAFRLWLKARYQTPAELNKVWNGAFWSNEFSDWDQIHFPFNSGEGGWQPAISLDYRRFFSDSYTNHLRRQAIILKQHVKDQFLFTNWPACTWSVDVFKAGEQFLDAAGWDNYVSAPGLSDFERQYIAGFNNDFCRVAGRDQHFLCGEQIAYVPPNALPQGLRLQAYINLAHGSHGHSYFEWRRPMRGGEQFRPSFIKGFDGRINPANDTFIQIGKEFAELGPRLANATTNSLIALIYDFTNEWAQGFWSVGTKGDHYDSEALRYYNGLKVLQQNIDVIPLSKDLSSYRLVVAQNLRLIDDPTVVRLEKFVSDGGTLVLNFRAATQNLDSSMRSTLAPGAFIQLVGASSSEKLDMLEYSPSNGQLDAALQAQLKIRFNGQNAEFAPRSILEVLQLHGAMPVATYEGGRLDGLPAVVSRKYGKGSVVYVATDSSEFGFYEEVARVAGAMAGLAPLIKVPYGVEVTSRHDTQYEYFFLLNLTETPHLGIQLPHAMDDIVSKKSGLTKISLDPLAVAILIAPRT